jgi:hypothetical protein
MRKCPFNNCAKPIPESMFACRGHWYSLSKPERDRVWSAYNAYVEDKIGVEELRAIQQEVLRDRGTA